MKCARDVCDQLETLMERVEIYLVSAKCIHPNRLYLGTIQDRLFILT